MRTNLARVLAVLAAILACALIPLQAKASHCSNPTAAGSWAYSYTGTVFTQAGPLPAASVGRFQQDAAGNISGSQTRTVAGQAGVEEITGTVTVNQDCTTTANINVLVNGELKRTAVLALVYDTNINHLRGIFKSLTQDGTNVPVVLSIDGARLFRKD